MASEKDRIKDIKDKFSESYGSFTPLFLKMRESHMMYANQQWTEKDSSMVRKKNMYPMVYNMLKKNADVYIGLHRQNKTALKAQPEETGDNVTASIASILLHHAMRKGGGYSAAASASKDQGIGGLSWLSPYMDFSADPLNGEFKALCDSVFDIFPDPHFREVNLSDCNYIVKRKAIAKSTGAIMFPEHEKEILNSKSEYKSDFFVMDESGLKEKCVVKELWERVIVPHITIYTRGNIITVPKETYDKMSAEISVLKTEPDYAEVRHNKKMMKLAIVINDDFIVYDGKSIYEGDNFPFIPVFGFYNKSLDQWNLRVMGLLDQMKDSQREYNRVSVSMTHYLLSSIHSGWIMDKNAVDDLRVLEKGMSTPIIQKNPGKELRRTDPLQIPAVFMQYRADQFDNMMKLGLNAEMLGYKSSVESAKGMKMLNMQGMTAIGEMLDNYNTAFLEFGRISLAMILQYYDINKIKRILGQEYEWVTPEHIAKVRDMSFDLQIDDTSYSPVQKMYRLETKMQMAQYKIPGLEAEDFYDDLDIDAAYRMKLQQRMEQRKQQEAMIQQQQMASLQVLMASKARTEESKANNLNVQTQLMGTKVLENLGGMGVQPGDITRGMETEEEVPQ